MEECCPIPPAQLQRLKELTPSCTEAILAAHGGQHLAYTPMLVLSFNTTNGSLYP